MTVCSVASTISPGTHCSADLQVDGPFRPHTLEPGGSTGVPADPPELEEQDPPYVHFFPPPPTPAIGCHSAVSGTRPSVARESSDVDGTLSSPTSSSSSSTTYSNSGDRHEQDDPEYDYPNEWLVNLPSGKHIVICIHVQVMCIMHGAFTGAF